MLVSTGWLGGLIAAALLAWAFGSPSARGSGSVLRHGLRYQLLAFSLLGFGILGGALLVQYPRPAHVLPTYGLAAFFFCTGLWLVLDALLVKVRVGIDELEVRSPWWRTRRVPWSKVISYSPGIWKHSYYIHTQGHGRLHVPELPGIFILLDRIDRERAAKRVNTNSRAARSRRRKERERRR